MSEMQVAGLFYDSRITGVECLHETVGFLAEPACSGEQASCVSGHEVVGCRARARETIKPWILCVCRGDTGCNCGEQRSGTMEEQFPLLPGYETLWESSVQGGH